MKTLMMCSRKLMLTVTVAWCCAIAPAGAAEAEAPRAKPAVAGAAPARATAAEGAVMTTDAFDPATPVDASLAKDAPGLPKGLQERFDAYWNAMRERKFAVAYALEHPLFRQKVSLHAFTSVRNSPLQSASIVGHQVQAIAPADKRGIVNIVHTLSCSLLSQKPIEKTSVDRWIECHGNWYRIARKAEFDIMSQDIIQQENKNAKVMMDRLQQLAADSAARSREAAKETAPKTEAQKPQQPEATPAP